MYLRPFAELRVRAQGDVGWQHHDLLLGVIVLYAISTNSDEGKRHKPTVRQASNKHSCFSKRYRTHTLKPKDITANKNKTQQAWTNLSTY